MNASVVEESSSSSSSFPFLRRLGSSFTRIESSSSSSSSSSFLPFYQAPRQRHRWQDLQQQQQQQQHPHKQWGDIFFDLFYVAAAYNLGLVLFVQNDSPSSLTTAVLDFLGYFLPLQSLWMLQLLRDGRFLFATATLWETTLATWRFLTVACAVLHIRSNQSYQDMWGYCMAIAVGLFWHAISCVEIMYCQKYLPEPAWENHENEVVGVGVGRGRGDEPSSHHETSRSVAHHQRIGLEPAAFDTAVTTLHMIGIPFGLVVAAAIYAGRHSFTNNHRQGESQQQEEEEEDHVVIYLLLASSLWIILYHAIRQFINDFIFQRDHKRSVVPINVQYAIHRYGEWIMLMLGETVLSLLIVDPVHHADYYSTFFAGVLSIIMVEYLHFLSQPHDPDHHALRRNIYGAILHTTTMMFYSASLIVLGVSYKMMLYELVYEQDQGDSHGGYHQDTRSVLGAVFFQRTLAEASSHALDTEDRQKRIAILFSGSMAFVWMCLDILILAHHGWKNLCAAWKGSRSPVLVGMAQMGRWSLLIWFVSLPQYVTEPKMLSLLGVIGLFGQIVFQMIIYSLCPKNPVHEEEEEINRVLEYANARLRVIKSSGA